MLALRHSRLEARVILRHVSTLAGISVLCALVLTTSLLGPLEGYMPGPPRRPVSNAELSNAWLALFQADLVIAFLVVSAIQGVYLWRYAQLERQRAAELEARLTSSRLDTLRMQLAPHFVFNTLNSISGLVKQEPDTARRMIAALGDLLHAEYALRAFEFEAVGYLRKPYDLERLRATLRRVRRHIEADALTHPAPAEAMLATNGDRYLARIGVRQDSGSVRFLSTDEIVRIESANKYVVLRTDTESFVLRNTLSALSAQLDPAGFVRVHRCMIVRKTAVREVSPLFHGDFLITLQDGSEITLSRTWKDAFFE